MEVVVDLAARSASLRVASDYFLAHLAHMLSGSLIISQPLAPNSQIGEGARACNRRHLSDRWRSSRTIRSADRELECLVSDKVSWSDTPAFHNPLVVGSSPTSSTTQLHATGELWLCADAREWPCCAWSASDSYAGGCSF